MADVSYAAPNSSGYSLPFYWRFTIWGTKGVVEFSNGSKEVIVAIDGKPGTEIIIVPDVDTGNCLSEFVNELKGKSAEMGTESVIKATRDTLLIQQYSES